MNDATDAAGTQKEVEEEGLWGSLEVVVLPHPLPREHREGTADRPPKRADYVSGTTYDAIDGTRAAEDPLGVVHRLHVFAVLAACADKGCKTQRHVAEALENALRKVAHD